MANPYYATYLDILTRPRAGASSSSDSSSVAGKDLESDSTVHTPGGQNNTSHPTKNQIIAIVIGAVAAVVLLLAACCLIRCCYKKRSRNLEKKRGRTQGRGYGKIDGVEKLGDEDFSNQNYDTRDRLIREQSPFKPGMQYEPYRGAMPSASQEEALMAKV